VTATPLAEEVAMVESKKAKQSKKDNAPRGGAGRERQGKTSERTWADAAAKARTADDPRSRTPNDAAGQPSTRSFEFEE
jgi:hypothetical protein